MPCRHPCRFYIHLAFHILRWSLEHSVWSGPHPQCQRKYSINQAQDKDSSCQQNLSYFNHLEAISDWSKYESTIQPYYYTKQQLQITSALNIWWSELTHTLISCWMLKPLPSRNQYTGWFAPTNIWLCEGGWIVCVETLRRWNYSKKLVLP